MSTVHATFRSALRCVAAVMFLGLGACGDNDNTPITQDTSVSSGKLSLASGGSGGGGVSPQSADYRLGPNDKLRVIVFGQPTLTGEFSLDGSGVLAFPLIGNIPANGMTPRELQQAITSKLDPEYMRNPSVSVEVAMRRPFYVVGEVQKPGSYSYVTDLTLLEAVATAGGQTYRANMANFYIKRRVNGQIVRVAASQESLIQPGDTVIVRERYF